MLQAAFCTRGRSRHRILTRNPYHKPAAFSDYLLGGSGQLPLGDTTRHILFYVAPPLVFISGILFNQFGIFYFNIVMNHTVFVPIVNTKGDVMGKAIASEAINRKNDYINPVIRIAVASHGMLFLLPRPKCNVFEKDKIDLLMEGYLIYGETLEQGAHRILRQTLPTAPLDHLHFNFMYHLRMKPPTAWSISSH